MKILKVLVVVFFAGLSGLLYGDRLETPIDTMVRFYDLLYMEEIDDESVDIFYEPKVLCSVLPSYNIEIEDNFSKIVLSYLRGIRSSLLPEGYLKSTDKMHYFESGGVAYSFLAMTKDKMLRDAVFVCEVRSVVTIEELGQISKIVSFRMISNSKSTGPKYLIEPVSITVNGIPLPVFLKGAKFDNLAPALGLSFAE